MNNAVGTSFVLLTAIPYWKPSSFSLPRVIPELSQKCMLSTARYIPPNKANKNICGAWWFSYALYTGNLGLISDTAWYSKHC